VSDTLPIIAFETPGEWENWLKKHHDSSSGLWVRLFKKKSGKASITYAEALDGALCYGWIDSQKQSDDADAWLQRFSPRKAKSLWSAINTGHVERLIKEGRMTPAGLVHVEAAKKDGRWKKAYASQGTMEVPADFLRELKKDKKALAFFGTLNKVNRYAIAFRLHNAKKPETREKRMKTFLEMMKKGEKFYA
jgi:uncharacterized protein YdeI (YjbR/CyaY-like superfamily)